MRSALLLGVLGAALADCGGMVVVLRAHRTSFLMPARRASGHPDIQATDAARSIGGPHERPAVMRETRLQVERRRVPRRPEIHRGGPRLVDALARGYPQIGESERAGAG